MISEQQLRTDDERLYAGVPEPGLMLDGETDAVSEDDDETDLEEDDEEAELDEDDEDAATEELT